MNLNQLKNQLKFSKNWLAIIAFLRASVSLVSIIVAVVFPVADCPRKEAVFVFVRAVFVSCSLFR